jgi:hypothetical protein
MVRLTIHILGHPDYTEPQTFVAEPGKPLSIKPAVLARAKQLTITLEPEDAEKAEPSEAGEHLPAPATT